MISLVKYTEKNKQNKPETHSQKTDDCHYGGGSELGEKGERDEEV